MNSSSLHPNLARIAATYDALLVDLSHQRLTNEQAAQRISALEARDDNGVRWRLSPTTGQWERYTIAKGWVEGIPPTFGLATPSAHDFSDQTGTFNPNHQIAFMPVDEHQLRDPLSLTGATRETSPLRPEAESPKATLYVAAVILVAVVAVIVFIVR